MAIEREGKPVGKRWWGWPMTEKFIERDRDRETKSCRNREGERGFEKEGEW